MKDIPKEYANMVEYFAANQQKIIEENAALSKSKYGFITSKGGHVPFLTPKELAFCLRVSVKALERWRNEKKGPPYLKIGNKRIRYFIKPLEAWVEENMVGTV